jgi:hypothetical protein
MEGIRRRQGNPAGVFGLLELDDVQPERPVVHVLRIVLLEQDGSAHARPLQVGPCLVCAQFAGHFDDVGRQFLSWSRLHACSCNSVYRQLCKVSVWIQRTLRLCGGRNGLKNKGRNWRESPLGDYGGNIRDSARFPQFRRSRKGTKC